MQKRWPIGRTFVFLYLFRCCCYSSEGNEPPHVHVQKADAEGSLVFHWPDEDLSLKGFLSNSLRGIIFNRYKVA